MCGRYLITSPEDELADLLHVSAQEVAAARPDPRWNAAPTQDLPVARTRSTGERTVEAMRWGLVPGWSKDPASARAPINARAETAATKPSFRTAMKRRRAVVPADGFYEWRKMDEGPKQPWLFRRADGRPLLLGGLWEHWQPKVGAETADGDDANPYARTFAILTTAADATVAPVHDRMPVVLEEDELDRWLDPDLDDPAELEDLLRLGDGTLPERLEGVRISRHVNNVRNDDPTCAEPVDTGGLFGDANEGTTDA